MTGSKGGQMKALYAQRLLWRKTCWMQGLRACWRVCRIRWWRSRIFSSKWERTISRLAGDWQGWVFSNYSARSSSVLCVKQTNPAQKSPKNSSKGRWKICSVGWVISRKQMMNKLSSSSTTWTISRGVACQSKNNCRRLSSLFWKALVDFSAGALIRISTKKRTMSLQDFWSQPSSGTIWHVILSCYISDCLSSTFCIRGC